MDSVAEAIGLRRPQNGYHMIDAAHYCSGNMAWLTVAVAVLLAVSWAVYRWKLWGRWEPRLDHRFPTVGSPNDTDLSGALLEGYKKYPDTPFIIPTKPPRLILPMSLLQEVIYAPEDTCSFNKEVYETFLGQYTAAGTPRAEVIHAVRSDLTKSLTQIGPLLQEEARWGFAKEIGQPDEWKSVSLYSTMLRIVALLSGRVFVGLPLSRDDEWVKMSINYTVDLAEIARVIAKWHTFARPFVAPFLPKVWKLRKDLRKARELMDPLVRDVMSANDLSNNNATGNAHDDREKTAPVKAGTRGTFISWMLQHLPNNLRNAERIGQNQMLVTFAAIHTTTMTSTAILLDLASRPEYIAPLREEAEQVLREMGSDSSSDGVDEQGRPYISKAAVAKMRKLDSFIKESQRTTPLGFVNSGRRLMRDITFKNGLLLARGTRVSFPMWGLYNSEEFIDEADNAAAGNKGPEEFDGFRFARLRELPGREAKHQAVTTGPDALNFGHGPHACPGRFFAIYEIKTMVLEFIRAYDFRLEGDVEGTGGVEKRPKKLVNELGHLPDFTAKLEVRRRTLI